MAVPEDGWINGVYELLTGEAPPGGGGLPGFAVRDHRNGRRDLMAVQVARDAPARSLAIGALSNQTIENMILPVASGVGVAPGGREGFFVVQPAAAGRAVLDSSLPVTPWGERALLDNLLRPAAIALDRLHQAGFTHRAIRASNVFQPWEGASVVLGGAWAAPPGALQTAVFEPPYSAMCHPSGRGEGSIADDVYALGVLLIALATGEMPMAGMSAEEIIHHKLERGSIAAVIGRHRIASGIVDLARGMLAEDPDHRPLPVLLADPLAARSRRVAARPPSRAQIPIDVAGLAVWDARSLAFALQRAPEIGLRLVRGPEMDIWLRRALGDPVLASRVEEAVRDAISPQEKGEHSVGQYLLLHVIIVLDRFAPCCWRGVAFFPDGIGTLAAAADGSGDRIGLRDVIGSFLLSDAIPLWSDAGERRADSAVLRLDWRQNRMLLQTPSWAGGFARLRYALNPVQPCLSPMVGESCVVRLSDALPALERQASGREWVIDAELAGFLSARMKGRLDAEFSTLSVPENREIDPPGHRGLAQLRILARLAEAEPMRRWPVLAKTALPSVEPVTLRWHAATQRAQRRKILRNAAQEGALLLMLAALDDPASLHDDARRAQLAADRVLRLEHELSQIATQQARRRIDARRSAQEVAAACGTILLVAVVVWRAMP